MNPNAKACDDFYDYTNGGWLATHDIPPEYTSFGYPYEHRFDRFEEAFAIVRGLLRDGYFVYVNKAYVTMLGYESAEELMAVPIASLVHPEDVALQRARSKQVFAITAPAQADTSAFLTPNEERGSMNAPASPASRKPGPQNRREE